MQHTGVTGPVLGALAFAIGVLVYMTDRDLAHVPLLPNFIALRGHHLFGALGGWLPSFVQLLAFGLFTAAVLRPALRPTYGACVF